MLLDNVTAYLTDYTTIQQVSLNKFVFATASAMSLTPHIHSALISEVLALKICIYVTVRFTLSLWLYVNNYCPHPSIAFCSIFQHITWDDRHATPQLYFNQNGKTISHHRPLTPVLYLSASPHAHASILGVIFGSN